MSAERLLQGHDMRTVCLISHCLIDAPVSVHPDMSMAVAGIDLRLKLMVSHGSRIDERCIYSRC